MALVVGGLAVLIIFLKSILGPKSTSPLKEEPFETGEAPFAIVEKSHSDSLLPCGPFVCLV